MDALLDPRQLTGSGFQMSCEVKTGARETLTTFDITREVMTTVQKGDADDDAPVRNKMTECRFFLSAFSSPRCSAG